MRPVAVTVRVKSLEMGSRSQNSEIELVVEFLDLFISFGMIFWDVILGGFFLSSPIACVACERTELLETEITVRRRFFFVGS